MQSLSIFQLVKKQQKEIKKTQTRQNFEKLKQRQVIFSTVPWAIPADVSMEKNKKKG